MPGSRRWFAYFDDSGQERYVDLDETNGETIALGFGQSITAAVFNDNRNHITVSNKRPIEMRYLLAQRLDADQRVVRRRFYVGALSAPVWSTTQRTFTVAGEEWNITAKIGEKRYLPAPTDTNIIDGDVDNNVTAAA